MPENKIPEILSGSTAYLQSLGGRQLGFLGKGAALMHKETIRVKVKEMLDSLLDKNLHILPLGDKNYKLSDISFFNDYSLRMNPVGEKILALFAVDKLPLSHYKKGIPMEIFYTEEDNKDKGPQRKGVEATILAIIKANSQLVVEISSREIKDLSPRKSYRINVGDDRIDINTESFSLEKSEIINISGNGLAMRYVPTNKDDVFSKGVKHELNLKSKLSTNNPEVKISATVVREGETGNDRFVAFQIEPESNEALMELLATIQRNNAKTKVRTKTD